MILDWLAVNIPDWSSFEVATKATYLRIPIGPGVNGDAWVAPLKKWLTRSCEIASSSAPLGTSLKIYAQQAITVTQYVSQLCAPPRDADILERRILSKISHSV